MPVQALYVVVLLLFCMFSTTPQGARQQLNHSERVRLKDHSLTLERGQLLRDFDD